MNENRRIDLKFLGYLKTLNALKENLDKVYGLDTPLWAVTIIVFNVVKHEYLSLDTGHLPFA